jgi:phospholipid/cholesterol/gamma-HCH transport system permease protein
VNVIVRVVEGIGARLIGFVEELGRAMRLLWRGVANLFRRPVRWGLTVKEIEFIGIQSLPIILLSAAFTGAVFTYESHEAFALFGAEGLVGGTVGVAITREHAPTLTGLLVAGRAGSAMAAELGSMRVTEQVDALEAMAVDPINYLVKPRLLASLVSLPLLTVVFDVVGIFGSYFVAMNVLGIAEPEFMVRLQDWVDWDDIWAGLVKSLAYGLIIGTVACYKGYYTTGGAEGVGRATTSAVVVASVVILITNYFIALALPTPV